MSHQDTRVQSILQHPATKWSGSILTTPEPTRSLILIVYLAHGQVSFLVDKTAVRAAKNDGRKRQYCTHQDDIVHVGTWHFDVSDTATKRIEMTCKRASQDQTKFHVSSAIAQMEHVLLVYSDHVTKMAAASLNRNHNQKSHPPRCKHCWVCYYDVVVP